MGGLQRAVAGRVVRALAVLAGIVAAAALAACSAPYDPVPPRDEPLRVVNVTSPLDMESSYRRLYTRLDACVSGIGYHVLPRFDRAAGHAWLLVTQGLRLESYAFLVSSFAARFDVYADATGARVEISQRDAGLQSLVDAAPAWLRGEHARCAD